MTTERTTTNLVGDGAICAFRVDDAGRALPTVRDEAARRGGPGYGWVHLGLADQTARTWIERSGSLDTLVAEALVDRKSPPDLHVIGDGILLTLEDRTLELDDPTGEIGELRVWIQPDRIVTARWRPLWATNRMRQTLREGSDVPGTTLEFLARMVDCVVADFEQLVEAQRAELDRIEDAIVAGRADILSGRLGVVRRDAIDLRRHVHPKRRVLHRLHAHFPAWGTAEDRVRFGASVDEMERLAAAIAEVEERARQLQDEYNALISERTGRTLYVLTVMSAILLPLNVVTGIWGMNMGGLPWVEPADGNGFLYVMGIMVTVLVGMIGLMRLKRWI